MDKKCTLSYKKKIAGGEKHEQSTEGDVCSIKIMLRSLPDGTNRDSQENSRILPSVVHGRKEREAI